MPLLKMIFLCLLLHHSTKQDFFKGAPQPLSKLELLDHEKFLPVKIKFDLSLFHLPIEISSVLQTEILEWVSRRIANMILVPAYDAFSIKDYPNCLSFIHENFVGKRIENQLQDVLVVVIPFENQNSSGDFTAKSRICFLDPRTR
jgi:hypothetical protein